MARPGSLVCYTISSSESETEEEDEEKEIPSAQSAVSHVIEFILREVSHGMRDFSDMYIKQEPEDCEEEWEGGGRDYRDQQSSADVKLDSDSEDSDSSSSSDEESSLEDVAKEKKKKNTCGESEGPDLNPPRTKNEMRLCDLPPVEELNLSVPEHEVLKIGTVSSSVEELVVIESLPGTPAIDLDSVLFLESGRRALGRVFDVIGPVIRPLYCVRFNSAAHIRETGVVRGMDVFFAPRTEYTTFVFLEQLMKMKISDASWKDDEEPPPDFLEYSDDEEERNAKKNKVIDKMVQRGASHEEVEAKRAKLVERGRGRGRGRGGRGGADGRSHGGEPNWSEERNDGNMGFNAQRFDNGLYARSTNPFYRQSRHYDPREQGGRIQWNNYHHAPPPPGPPTGYFTAGYAASPRPNGSQPAQNNGPQQTSYNIFSVPPPPFSFGVNNPWTIPPPSAPPHP